MTTPRFEGIGAVQAWNEELRQGVGGQDSRRSSTWRLDNLWRAACAEKRAADLHALGLYGAAQRALDAAAELLVREAAA